MYMKQCVFEFVFTGLASGFHLLSIKPLANKCWIVVDSEEGTKLVEIWLRMKCFLHKIVFHYIIGYTCI